MRRQQFILSFFFLFLLVCIFPSLIDAQEISLTSITPSLAYNVPGTKITLQGENLDTLIGLKINGALSTDLSMFQPSISANVIILTLPPNIPEHTYMIAVVNQNHETLALPLTILLATSPYPPAYPFGVGKPSRSRSRDIWFTPNFGTEDYMDLFTKEDQWPHARANIDVFSFYQQSILNTDSIYCKPCGDVSYINLLAAGAFSKLKQWNIDIAMESIAIDGNLGCEAEAGIPQTLHAMNNIYQGGGEVAYIALDSSYLRGVQTGGPAIPCKYTIQRSAQEVAEYITTIKSLHPSIKIGDVEPLPYFRAQQHIDWVLELERQGITLDFYHLDVSRNTAKAWNVDVAPDIQQLKTFFANKNIPFGIIYWGDTLESTDASFYNNVLQWVTYLKDRDLIADHHIFQSWHTDPQGNQRIPINLPEDDSNVYSMTRLLTDGLALLYDQDATFISQSAPSVMQARQQYTVSLIFKDTGSTSWEASRQYFLSSQSPQDTLLWGINRVPFSSREVVNTNGEKNFTFMITAPATSGTYTFQWRMVHEGVEHFGDSSVPLKITVVQSCENGEKRLCLEQRGVCAGSQETCTREQWPGCTIETYSNNHPSYSTSELNMCNDGLDNDCDGGTDNQAAPYGDTECKTSIKKIVPKVNTTKTPIFSPPVRQDNSQPRFLFVFLLIILILFLILFLYLRSRRRIHSPLKEK